MAIDTLGANALASDSVTTAKIVNDAVTAAKIPAGAVVADIADGGITTAKLADDAVTAAKIDDDGTGFTLGDLTVDTDTLKVDSSNNRIGIGTTSPDSVVNIEATKTNALSSEAHFRTLGLCIDDNTAYNTALAGGGIAFRHIKNSSGDMNVYGAIDGVRIDNANGRVGGHLRFFTNTDSDGIPKERIRIDSSGAVMVATTNNDVASTSGTGNEGHVFPVGAPAQHAVSNSVCLDLNRKTSDGVIVNLRKNGSSVGSISTNANSLPSDKNFKRDIKDLNIGLNLVSQLQPKSFNLIVDDENSPVMYGLVAQDLEIALEKVGVTKNSAWILQHEEKNDAKESDYSLDYSKLIPILINALQEAVAKIETLEIEVAKLKG